MDLGIGGKVVLVTGGSSGIGEVIVRALLAEGARVAVYARRAVAEGDACISLRGDVRDPAAVQAAMDAAVARFGRVDGCVACAGIWPEEALPIHEAPEARIREVIDVNLLGTIWTARAFFAALARAGAAADGRGASLVLVGSTAGRFGEPGHAEYAASKAALRGLVGSLKTEIARIDPRGRVNLVEPGWTVTPMTAAAIAEGDLVERVTRTMPLRQLATAEDVARAVLFFLSPALARHVTGEVLTVAGGMDGRVLW